MPDTVSSQFERMFNSLFELIRDSTKSVNALVNEVGKERGGVNEFMQLVRDRPCFDKDAKDDFKEVSDKAISAIQKIQNEAKKENLEAKELFIKKIEEIKDDANKRIMKFMYVMGIILIAVNSFVFFEIVYFIGKNPQIWGLLEKLITK